MSRFLHLFSAWLKPRAVVCSMASAEPVREVTEKAASHFEQDRYHWQRLMMNRLVREAEEMGIHD